MEILEGCTHVHRAGTEPHEPSLTFCLETDSLFGLHMPQLHALYVSWGWHGIDLSLSPHCPKCRFFVKGIPLACYTSLQTSLLVSSPVGAHLLKSGRVIFGHGLGDDWQRSPLLCPVLPWGTYRAMSFLCQWMGERGNLIQLTSQQMFCAASPPCFISPEALLQC